MIGRWRITRSAAWTAALALVALAAGVIAPGVANAAAPHPSAAVSTSPDRGRVIELRRDDVRLLAYGAVVWQRTRPSGLISLDQLARFIAAPGWLSVNRGVAVLRAGLYQEAGTALAVKAPAIHTLRLVPSSDGTGGVLWGSGAEVTFLGVTVTGWDAVRGQAIALNPHRPYVYYSNGSSVGAFGATFRHLGRAVRNGTGVTIGAESSADVIGASFISNAVGLTASHATRVRVVASRFAGAAADGLAIHGCADLVVTDTQSRSNGAAGFDLSRDNRASLTGLSATGNAGIGLLISRSTGAMARSLAVANNAEYGVKLFRAERTSLVTLSTTDNALAGVSVDASRQITISGLTATNDATAGLSVHDSRAVTAAGTTVADAPTGISIGGGSTAIAVTSGTLQHGRIGISTQSSVSGVVLSGLRLSGFTGEALELGGSALTARGIAVTHASVGIRLTRGGSGIRVASTTLADVVTGARSGPLTDHLVFAGLRVRDATGIGLDISSSATSVAGARITDSASGVRVHGSVSAIRLSDVAATTRSVGIDVAHSVGELSIVDARLTGARVGVDTGAVSTVITGGTVINSAIGVRVSGEAVVTALSIRGCGMAFRAGNGAHISVAGSTIRAQRVALGQVQLLSGNDLPPGDMSWFGIIAVAVAAGAFGCEALRYLRERKERGRAWLFPPHVTNVR